MGKDAKKAPKEPEPGSKDDYERWARETHKPYPYYQARDEVFGAVIDAQRMLQALSVPFTASDIVRLAGVICYRTTGIVQREWDM